MGSSPIWSTWPWLACLQAASANSHQVFHLRLVIRARARVVCLCVWCLRARARRCGNSMFHFDHSSFNSGVAQWLACWAHNPKVQGSRPCSATPAPSTRQASAATRAGGDGGTATSTAAPAAAAAMGSLSSPAIIFTFRLCSAQRSRARELPCIEHVGLPSHG